MLDWERPKTVKDLRGFLELTGYYRRFVKDYGKIAKPLTKLLKKGEFSWNERAEEALSKLKRAITTAQYLYKARVTNKAADALSRKNEGNNDEEKELCVLARPYWKDFEEIVKEVEEDEILQKVIDDIRRDPNTHPTCTLERERLGGHSGVYRTYRKVARSLYWIGMKKDVTGFFASYLGYDAILVVVDHLSKYGHFLPLKHPYMARTIADIFVKEIVKLHGVPISIGTQLKMSTAYHPESYGQMEMLNRVLEGYLRCFYSEKPRGWMTVLPWTEYLYNTNYQGTIRCTPFEAVYGRSPPSLHRFIPGKSLVEVVSQELQTRDEALRDHQGSIGR
ncbi:uncharacterized protein LOC108330338 [Vigna angularis]|uniref:uncharacterized protein LOC108330338 n=1 Tax=Phaseolus angularis TaxID=3914 RepID=UPI000809D70C|nr:uncharacterized protein LOC108330338 [Vigna angularis]